MASSEPTVVRVALDEAAGFHAHAQARSHTLAFDEPRALGGDDEAPTPVETLLSALGACTALTLRMYASRKGWPLGAVQVTLTHDHLRRADCLDCPPDADQPMADRIHRVITLGGPLDDEQRARLLDIADRCPVHRILSRRPVVVTTLEPS